MINTLMSKHLFKLLSGLEGVFMLSKRAKALDKGEKSLLASANQRALIGKKIGWVIGYLLEIYAVWRQKLPWFCL